VHLYFVSLPALVDNLFLQFKNIKLTKQSLEACPAWLTCVEVGKFCKPLVRSITLESLIHSPKITSAKWWREEEVGVGVSYPNLRRANLNHRIEGQTSNGYE